MRTVIVVDDEPIVRMDISGMLEELEFQVIGEAGDGFDAVEACRIHHPDVVLMDVKMPVFDGLAAAETIFQEELSKCVVLLTAFGDREIVEQAKRAGVTGYLMKPVEQRLLLPTVEVALAQSERLRQSRQETEQIRGQLAENRIIQRAQGIMAAREKISEAKAYQLLRQMSMDKRVPVVQLAQAIIEQERRTDQVALAKERLMRQRHVTEAQAFKRITERARELGCSREEAARRILEELP